MHSKMQDEIVQLHKKEDLEEGEAETSSSFYQELDGGRG